ncbi:hypothetical protein [Kiloniella sp. b19]|uniref:hypothetical protein n=1 Tax=Kiloniella sp. GXU_MW_B19 TaxID=3141326 RepID=UPI0031D9C6EA
MFKRSILPAVVLNVFLLQTGQASQVCPGTGLFDKSALVFDSLVICAKPDVPAAKLTHAAQVAAEWLDNDGDGRIDEPRLLDSMKKSKPLLVMSQSEFSERDIERLEDTLDDRIVQDLYGQETNPGGSRRDASQEEIHHLVINAGWAVLYPDIFSDQPRSKVYRAWQKADREGYYSYNDPTCDAACKSTEFFYLATAAYLGSDADLHSDEMRLKNRKTLKDSLPETVRIIESDAYSYPKFHWPTGHYSHSSNIVYSGL